MNNHNFQGFKSLFNKECARFFAVAKQTLVSPLINTTLYLLIFGVNLADKIDDQNGVKYLSFLIPGLIGLGLINNAFQNSTSSVITSKFHGDFQDLKVAPLGLKHIIWAYGLAATFRGILVGILTVAVGEAFHWVQYGSLIGIYNPLLFLVFMVLGGLIFGFLGLSVAIYASNFDQVSAISTFVILPLIYLGGVFFSIEQLAPFWTFMSQLNPLLYLINGIRYAVLGTSDITWGVSLLLCIVFLIANYFIAAHSVRNGRYGRF